MGSLFERRPPNPTQRCRREPTTKYTAGAPRFVLPLGIPQPTSSPAVPLHQATQVLIITFWVSRRRRISPSPTLHDLLRTTVMPIMSFLGVHLPRARHSGLTGA